MSKQIPEIRIQPGWLLYYGESKLIYDNIYAKEGHGWATKEQLSAKTKDYIAAWGKVANKILNAMSKVYELSFEQSHINAYITPYFVPKSHPLILNPGPEPDLFIDVLTHELFHILLTENAEHIETGKIFNNLYPAEDRKARNHIFVHAGLKHIYLDVLKEPKRLERDVQRSQKIGPGYIRAWEIVETEGYREIISRFKNQY